MKLNILFFFFYSNEDETGSKDKISNDHNKTNESVLHQNESFMFGVRRR